MREMIYNIRRLLEEQRVLAAENTGRFSDVVAALWREFIDMRNTIARGKFLQGLENEQERGKLQQIAGELTQRWADVHAFAEQAQQKLGRYTQKHPVLNNMFSLATFAIYKGMVMRYHERILRAAYKVVQEEVVKPFEERTGTKIKPSETKHLGAYMARKAARKYLMPAVIVATAILSVGLTIKLLGLLQMPAAVIGAMGKGASLAVSLGTTGIFWAGLLLVIVPCFIGWSLWKIFGERIEAVNSPRDLSEYAELAEPIEGDINKSTITSLFKSIGKYHYKNIGVRTLSYISLLGTIAAVIATLVIPEALWISTPLIVVGIINILSLLTVAHYIYTYRSSLARLNDVSLSLPQIMVRTATFGFLTTLFGLFVFAQAPTAVTTLVGIGILGSLLGGLYFIHTTQYKTPWYQPLRIGGLLIGGGLAYGVVELMKAFGFSMAQMSILGISSQAAFLTLGIGMLIGAVVLWKILLPLVKTINPQRGVVRNSTTVICMLFRIILPQLPRIAFVSLAFWGIGKLLMNSGLSLSLLSTLMTPQVLTIAIPIAAVVAGTVLAGILVNAKRTGLVLASGVGGVVGVSMLSGSVNAQVKSVAYNQDAVGQLMEKYIQGEISGRDVWMVETVLREAMAIEIVKVGEQSGVQPVPTVAGSNNRNRQDAALDKQNSKVKESSTKATLQSKRNEKLVETKASKQARAPPDKWLELKFGEFKDFLTSLFSPASASAQEPEKQLIQPKAEITEKLDTLPLTAYIVRRGDTLWDIAEEKLGNAYLWRKIAERYNAQHPDKPIRIEERNNGLIVAYIYPGQELIVVKETVPSTQSKEPEKLVAEKQQVPFQADLSKQERTPPAADEDLNDIAAQLEKLSAQVDKAFTVKELNRLYSIVKTSKDKLNSILSSHGLDNISLDSYILKARSFDEKHAEGRKKISDIEFKISLKIKEIREEELKESIADVKEKIKDTAVIFELIKNLAPLLKLPIINSPGDINSKDNAITYVVGLLINHLSKGPGSQLTAKKIVDVYIELYENYRKKISGVIEEAKTGLNERDIERVKVLCRELHRAGLINCQPEEINKEERLSGFLAEAEGNLSHLGLPNALNVKNGEFFETADAGPNAWFLIGLSHFISSLNEKDDRGKYIEFGRKIADYLISLTFKGTFKGGNILGIRQNPGSDSIPLENVISAKTALRIFSQIDSDRASDYQKYIEGLERLSALSFVGGEYYNFYRGYKVNKGVLEPDKHFATDVALWLLLFEDKTFFSQYNINPEKLFKSTIDKAKVIMESGERKYTLLDYIWEQERTILRDCLRSDKLMGKDREPVAVPLGSIEWSQFAVAVQNKWQFTTPEVKTAVAEIDNSIAELYKQKGYLPYALNPDKVSGIEVYDNRFETGHGIKTPDLGSPDLTAALWRALGGDNLLTLEVQESSYQNIDLSRFVQKEDFGLLARKLKENLAIIEKDYQRLLKAIQNDEKLDPRTGSEMVGLTLSLYHFAGSYLGLNFALGEGLILGPELTGTAGNLATLGLIGYSVIKDGIASGFLPWLVIVDAAISTAKNASDDLVAQYYQRMQKEGAVIKSVEGRLLPWPGETIKVLFSESGEEEIWKFGILRYLFEKGKDFISEEEMVVILSEKMRYAYCEAIFLPRQGYSYFAQRKGDQLIIYRSNGKREKIIAVQKNVFLPGTDKFLAEKLNIRLEDKERKRISGVREASNVIKYSDIYFNPDYAFIAIDRATQAMRSLRFNQAGFAVKDSSGMLMLPETGEVLVPTLALRLIDGAFRGEESLEIDGAMCTPAVKIISFENGLSWLYKEELKDLPGLNVVFLKDDITIPYSNGLKIIIKKGAAVTYQKPFAVEVEGVPIPAIVEYPYFDKDYVAIVQDEAEGINFSSERPHYTRTISLPSEEILKEMEGNEGFWKNWISEHSPKVVSLADFKKPILPILRIERKVSAGKDGVGFGDYLTLALSVTYPQDVSKDAEYIWEKTFRVDFLKLFGLDYRSVNIKFEKDGSLPALYSRPAEDALEEGEIGKVTGPSFDSYKFSKEEGYFPSMGKWLKILHWKPTKEGLRRLIDGLSGWGLKIAPGKSPEILSAQDIPYLKLLRDASDEDLAKAGITREEEDGRREYYLEINGKKVRLGRESDDSFERSLILIKDNELYFIELGLGLLNNALDISRAAGVIYPQELGIPARVIEKDELTQIIREGRLYAIKNKQGDTVLTVKGYQEINGVLELSIPGLKALQALKKESIAQLIGEDGRIILAKAQGDLKYTTLAFLASDNQSPAGFRLKEATPEQVEKGISIVNAVFTQSGNKYLVEYLPDKILKELQEGPAILRSDGKRILLSLEELNKGIIAYPAFYKIRPAEKSEERWEYSSILGEKVKVKISSEKDKATLVMEKDGKDYITWFSPEVQAFFEWANKYAYAYQIIPGQGAKLYTSKQDMPATWYSKRTDEVLIVGKPRSTKNYRETIQRLARAWAMDEGEFINRFYDKENKQGAVFDLNNGLVVYTDKGKEETFLTKYLLGKLEVIEATKGGELQWRVYPKAEEVVIGSEIYECTKYPQSPDDLAFTKGDLLAKVEKIRDITFANRNIEVWKRDNIKGKDKIYGIEEDSGIERVQFYFKPQTVKVQDVQGVAVIDLGEFTSKYSNIREKRNYTGNEPISRIYYYGADYNILPKLGIKGYAIETDDKIEKYGTWTVVEEIEFGDKFKFISARAVDKHGKERASISRLPEGEYLIAKIDYINREESVRTSFMATKERRDAAKRKIYNLSEKLSTFEVFKGEELESALLTFNNVKKLLPNEAPHMWKDNFQKTLNGIKHRLGSLEISAGRLSKEHDGTFTVYRAKNDYLARIIAQDNPDRTWQLNLEWDDNGQPTKSIMVWTGQALSLSKSKAISVETIFENKEVFEKTKRMFRKAQRKADFEAINLWDYLSQYGVKEFMSLPKITITSYRKEGNVNSIKFTSQAERATALYLIPNDPLGRVLMEERTTSKGYILTVNMWNWEEATTVPIGILPGSISIRVTKGKGWLNNNRVRIEEIKFYKANLTIKGREGYLYVIINGGYKQTEFYTVGGQLYREKFMKAVSTLAKHAISPTRYLYYSLDFPFRKPDVVTDKTGRVMEKNIDIKYQDGVEKQTWLNNAGIKGKLGKYIRLFKEWEKEDEFYDSNGEPTILPIKPEGSLWKNSSFIISIIIISIWPLLLLFRSFLTGRKWRRDRLVFQRNSAGGETLYTEDLEEKEHQRLQQRLFNTEVSGVAYKSNMDSSFLFIKSLRRIRILILAGVQKWEGELVDLLGDHPLLNNVDDYCKKVSEYLGSHYSKELVQLVPWRKDAVKVDTPYDQIGKPDEEIWDKLELYFYNIEHKLRKALMSKDEVLFRSILDNSGISHNTFDKKHFKAFLRTEGYKLYDRKVPVELANLIRELRGKANDKNKGQVPVNEEEYKKIAKYLKNFRKERWLRILGWKTKSIPPYLTEAAYYLPYGLILGVAVSSLYAWVMRENLLLLFSPSLSILLPLGIVFLLIIFNVWHQYKEMSQLRYQANKVFRWLPLLYLPLVTMLFISLPAGTLSTFVLKTIILTLLYLEGLVNLVFGRSLLGISFYRNFRPSIGIGRPRTVILRMTKYILFIGIGLSVAWFCMPWVYGHFHAGLKLRTLLGMYSGYGLFIYLMEYGLWPLVTFISALIKEMQGPTSIRPKTIQRFIDKGELIVINYVGHPLKSDPVRNSEKIIDCLEYLKANNSPEIRTLFEQVEIIRRKANMSD